MPPSHSTNRLAVRSLSSVKESAVSWLWPGRVPRGKVTLLCGDPGLGKSFMTMDMAARVTRAAAWPDAPMPLRQPGAVLVLSAEDDAEDTILPRIRAAEGDPALVTVCEGVCGPEQEGKGRSRPRVRGLDLDRDLEALEAHLAKAERCRLVIVDPISAYMGDVDSHNNTQVRGLLAELARLASTYGPAIVCVTHPNKNGQGKAVYRAMGSLAFTAAARMVWQVSKMPGATRDSDERAVTLVKSNLECAKTGLAFRLEKGRVEWTDTALQMTADEAEDSGTGEELRGVDEAMEFIRAMMSAGPVPAVRMFEEALRVGIASATLKRAKSRVGVSSRRVASAGGTGVEQEWVWVMP